MIDNALSAGQTCVVRTEHSATQKALARMLDWDDLRYFLAVARSGNLSIAAKELRVAQSTAGRRLASLEAGLGVRLLDRTPDGYVLTQAGERVRKEAERFETGSLALEREVGGRDNRLAGLVRVTCAESIASHILAPCIAELHRKHPDIMVELIPDPRELSLSMREADISVRLAQPQQHDLVVRRIGTVRFGLYASRGYLERHGAPDLDAGCPDHFLITQLDDIQDSAQSHWLADLAPRARVILQTSSHEAAAAAAIRDGGLACLACFRADREVDLTRLATPISAPDAGMWLVTHKDNRRNARIRVVLTQITNSVRGVSGEHLSTHAVFQA